MMFYLSSLRNATFNLRGSALVLTHALRWTVARRRVRSGARRRGYGRLSIVFCANMLPWHVFQQAPAGDSHVRLDVDGTSDKCILGTRTCFLGS